jgi:hypothetical protein
MAKIAAISLKDKVDYIKLHESTTKILSKELPSERGYK